MDCARLENEYADFWLGYATVKSLSPADQAVLL